MSNQETSRDVEPAVWAWARTATAALASARATAAPVEPSLYGRPAEAPVGWTWDGSDTNHPSYVGRATSPCGRTRLQFYLSGAVVGYADTPDGVTTTANMPPGLPTGRYRALAVQLLASTVQTRTQTAPLTPTELAVLADLLARLSTVQSNAGCNDYPLENTPANVVLWLAAETYDAGDFDNGLDDTQPNQDGLLWCDDLTITAYLQHRVTALLAEPEPKPDAE